MALPLLVMEAWSASRTRLISDGDSARLFLLDAGLVTDDNAAERLEVTDCDRDLCEVLVGNVLRLGFGIEDVDVYILTVP